ncbi:hypothetical protein R50072_15840 [Simiduia litorea]|uniref:DUF1853 family protein n=1 Tax=Simiduia litorea TaxID=1435348 RepID=UPI0036F1A858
MPTPDQILAWRGQQQARDLAWSLTSKELPKLDYVNSLTKQDYGTLSRKQITELPSTPLLEPKKRLGLYFEQLWQLLVSHHFNQTVIAANRQIIHAGATLGALDLLSYCDQKRTYFHYELAVKFYLEAKYSDQATGWIGPNSRDRLDLKLDRLLNHQLPLALDPRARLQIDQWLANKEMPSIESTKFKQKLVMKGWLFQHYQQPTGLEHSDYVNQECSNGRWLHYGETPHWLEQHGKTDKHWLLLPRLYWLSPAKCPVDFVKNLSPTELGAYSQLYLETPILLNTQSLTKLMQGQRKIPNAQALLVAEVELGADHWLEKRRFMWVNDYWPASMTAIARPSRNK